MNSPPLVIYQKPVEYVTHFEMNYCRAVIKTFDGIRVYFRQTRFGHCFYESTNRDNTKDLFSRTRAERIDWIKANLMDPSAELYQGWDKDKKANDTNCRVSVMYGNYVVIIRMNSNKPDRADFITAYVADQSILKIRSGPRWGRN